MPVGVTVQILARNGAIANLGQSYSLSCIVRGINGFNHSITYQWFKDQSLLPGEMASILYFSALTLSDTGNYSCEVYIRSTQQGHGTIIASSSHNLNFPSELVNIVVCVRTTCINMHFSHLLLKDIYRKCLYTVGQIKKNIWRSLSCLIES